MPLSYGRASVFRGGALFASRASRALRALHDPIGAHTPLCHRSDPQRHSWHGASTMCPRSTRLLTGSSHTQQFPFALSSHTHASAWHCQQSTTSRVPAAACRTPPRAAVCGTRRRGRATWWTAGSARRRRGCGWTTRTGTAGCASCPSASACFAGTSWRRRASCASGDRSGDKGGCGRL